MNTINCEYPCIILNPSLVELVLRSVKYYIFGHQYSITSEMKYSVSNQDSPSKVLGIPYFKPLSVKNDKMSDTEFEQCLKRQDDLLDSSFFVDSDGEITGFVWIKVPCGKCDVCLSSKVNSYVQRCIFAQEESKTQGIFVTLTYNNKHVPIDMKPDRRDLQLFMKKLKSAVRRCKWEPYLSQCADSIKWVYSSEIGDDGRPHYHTLIFGIPNLSPSNPTLADYRLHWLIYYAWRESQRNEDGTFVSLQQYTKLYPKVYKRPALYDVYSKGFCNVELMQTSKAVSYILKYAYKTFGDDSDGCFFGCSNNLGVDYVSSYKKYLVSSVEPKFKFVSFFGGALKEVSLSKYYLQKLFPSKSKLIPVELRRTFYNLVTIGEHLVQNPMCSKELGFAILETMKYTEVLFPFLSFDYFVQSKFKSVSCDRLVDGIYVSEDAELVFDFPEFNYGDYWSAGVFNSDYDFFLSQFQYLIEHQIDYEDVQKQLIERNLFFSKFSERSYSQICESGKRFRLQRIKHMSNKKI